MSLPYVPLTVAGATLVHELLAVPRGASAELALGLVLVLLVLARQMVALAENRFLVAALQRAHDDVQRQALHDPLTGLPNRVLFTDRLEHALAAAAAQDAGAGRGATPHATRPAVSVLYCDLDGFKAVNDEHGHDLGDELLRQVAGRLHGQLGPGDTVARLGGDEFAVLLEGPVDAPSVARRLVDAVDAPFELAGRPARVTLSVGVAAATGPAPSGGAPSTPGASGVPGDDPVVHLARRVLRDADRAMYAAKADGKGRASVAELTVPAQRPPSRPLGTVLDEPARPR